MTIRVTMVSRFDPEKVFTFDTDTTINDLRDDREAMAVVRVAFEDDIFRVKDAHIIRKEVQK